jgi:hypothetical protein
VKRSLPGLGMTGVLLAGPLVGQNSQADSAIVLDDFQTIGPWRAAPAEGVRLAIRADTGRGGRVMRLDFDFRGHGGYAIARRAIPLELPENYQFSFWIKGHAAPNTLEFKLIDPTGDNVWWHTRPDFQFPGQWQRISIRRRHIRFAWGPAGGGEPRRLSALELVVTAGRGGAGTVWIDDLTLTPRPPERPYDLTPRVSASSSDPGHEPTSVLDRDSSTVWLTSAPARDQWLALDFLRLREFGGVVVDWAPGQHARDYVVETSSDGTAWTTAYTVRGGNGGRDYLYLPESESRYLRLHTGSSGGGRRYGIRELTIEPVEWAESPNTFFRAMARDFRRGSFPRYLSDQQSYWTIVGVSGDGRRGLLNEDGALEPFAGGFSIEPFLQADGRLLTWNDVQRRQSLERGDLPIPTVEWTSSDTSGQALTLTITAFGAGTPGASSILARYRVANRSRTPARATLFLALRPFQVNPPWQFLNTPGGVAQVGRVEYRRGRVLVQSRTVVSLTPADAFGAARFDQGDIVEFLRAGELPRQTQVDDSTGHASAALAYPMTLPPGARREVFLEVPLYDANPPIPALSEPAARSYGERRLAETAREWRERLDQVLIQLPPAAGDLAGTIKANLGYILINRDGAAIEPGARSYRRSWIRDGALISSALLRLGQAEQVRRFLEWYAPYQYPDGKVPCCVDWRGADPVSENDSHGQLLYLAMEYYRHTSDRITLERMWPHAVAAVTYLDSLRRSRLTPPYQKAESLSFRGLLPQSISHEGYSAKPMHSYWDDFFALKGLKDAVSMAEALGRKRERARFVKIRDAFQHDLYASIGRAMAAHHIDYIPGSVELGDFDATSTTVAVAPAGELANLPQPALRRTFERYWNEFRARREGTKPWEGYTPYELRTVGTMLRLGWPDRAHELLQWFLASRRPMGWRQWAEVVWNDPATPKFIGDMPHTWVGSDFLRSVLDFFVYEREADGALVVGDGIPAAWVDESPGVVVRGLSTHYGRLSYSMREEGGRVRIRLEGSVRPPQGGIVVRSPGARQVTSATIDDQRAPVAERREVVVRRLPAEIILSY